MYKYVIIGISGSFLFLTIFISIVKCKKKSKNITPPSARRRRDTHINIPEFDLNKINI
tara:strand:- start:198 stop:371 length:174 start_codon:yes stop_codon:yes gene_type:complete